MQSLRLPLLSTSPILSLSDTLRAYQPTEREGTCPCTLPVEACRHHCKQQCFQRANAIHAPAGAFFQTQTKVKQPSHLRPCPRALLKQRVNLLLSLGLSRASPIFYFPTQKRSHLAEQMNPPPPQQGVNAPSRPT